MLVRVAGLAACPSDHRPYEGQQQEELVGHRADPPRDHRPYEGQQHRERPAYDAVLRVIIAPTRGSNEAYGSSSDDPTT